MTWPRHARRTSGAGGGRRRRRRLPPAAVARQVCNRRHTSQTHPFFGAPRGPGTSRAARPVANCDPAPAARVRRRRNIMWFTPKAHRGAASRAQERRPPGDAGGRATTTRASCAPPPRAAELVRQKTLLSWCQRQHRHQARRHAKSPVFRRRPFGHRRLRACHGMLHIMLGA